MTKDWNMDLDTIVGRSTSSASLFGNEGCCYLGRNVSYPGGEYEEMGSTFLDIVSPHCMLVLGKRGTGKSYTLGVLAEGFLELEKGCSEKIAVVIVDTMSVFHSLKTANFNKNELKIMERFGIEPNAHPEKVNILVPEAAVKDAKNEGKEFHYDGILKLRLASVEVHDWLKIFDLSITEPVGSLLCQTISSLKNLGPFSFQELYKEIEQFDAEDTHLRSLKGLFKMVEELNIFSKEGSKLQIAQAGKVTVLDISYLGRLGSYDLRSLVVGLFARKKMAERTLYASVEMQSQAGLVESDSSSDITQSHPLIYMFIDEAHLFLPSKDETMASSPLMDWIKLGRHPGLSLILATQEPSALHPSAIRQSDFILSHNLTAKDDVEALGKATQSYMSEGIDKMVSQMEFRRGLALLFDDKTRSTQYCMVRPRRTLHTGVDASALPEK